MDVKYIILVYEEIRLLFSFRQERDFSGVKIKLVGVVVLRR